MEKAKVLILEDELVVALDLEDMLLQRGYDVVGTASSGEDAIKLAQASHPDLILADIKLQGTLDGIDSAKRISENSDCAIVYLTAGTEPDLFDRAKETEAYGYLTKPVAPQELLRTVEMALYKHQMEKRLRESQEKLRLVIENAREAIYVIQGDRIKFANPFAFQLSGHSEEELYSTPYTEFIFADDREMMYQNYRRRLSGEYAPSRYSFRLVSKRGDPIWVEVDPVMITWEKHNAVLVFALDITERKKAEVDLKQSEEKFRLIAETIEDVFWISKPGITEMIYVSPAYEKIWGRTISSVYERPISFMEAVHPEDRGKFSGSIDEHARGSWKYEYRIVQPDGTVRWIEDHGFPVRDDKGTLRLMTGVARDITERKCAEEERERLVLALEKSLAELKRLGGLLPICASCKKIRDDQGYWQQIEAYVKDHSEAEFSHSICPECAEKLYPGFFPKDKK